jgi:adenylate kinase family enzyme
MPKFAATRIMVYGTTGSGKSTLAKRISLATGLPYHSIDDLTWMPNWQEVSLSGQREIIGRVVAEDRWVIDAGYGKWLDVVLPRVELIVGLDYPPPIIFFRLLRRTARRIVTGESICNGNRERLRMQFKKDSILIWFFKSYKRKRMRMRELFVGLSCDLIRFAQPREAAQWLKTLDSSDKP